MISGPGHFVSHFHAKQIMSRVEALRDTNLRSLLKELRTDIAMAVDDPFPLVYGLADKNIITDQLLKVRLFFFKYMILLQSSQQYTVSLAVCVDL